ncbi:MAG: redoxin family protein [Chloroflexi bacterium]|nr:redoxin family protein [Chloroflexota bacterium]
MKYYKTLLIWSAVAAIIAMAAVACGENLDPANSPTQVAPRPTLTTTTDTPSATLSLAPTATHLLPLPTYQDGVLEVHGGNEWLNSEGLKIADQTTDNKVVLVDFWTYTCVNCIRTLPFLKEWHAKYADNGLVILGVHTPEFEFEERIDNVQAAIAREGIGWPVVLDNEYDTWRSFGNRYWPAKYLIGIDGQLTYRHFGEGSYVETEHAIREALTEAGWDVSDIPIGNVNSVDRDPVADRVTRELYAGYERNYTQSGLYAGQDQYYIEPDSTREYVDDENYTSQQWYLQGLWTNGPESITHARSTSNLDDYIAFQFVGRSANVVVTLSGTEPYDVYIEIDGRPLKADEAGIDVIFGEDGRSYFTVTEPRLYAFLETPRFGEHIVKLASDSDDFAIFAFTFGANESGI